METRTLQAEVRGARGKGSARQLRMQGKIPAVAYGPGLVTTTLAVIPKELLKAIATPWGRNTVLKLAVGGSEHLVILKEIEVHPVSRKPVHADFYAVALDRPVVVQVPFEPTGKAPGVTLGGVLEVPRRQIPIRALPEKIPVKLTVDISQLQINDTLFMKDLVLPEGCGAALPANRPIVSIHGERKDQADAAAEAAAAAAAAAVPAEGVAGASAASGSQAPPAAAGDKAAAAPTPAGGKASGKAGGKPAKG